MSNPPPPRTLPRRLALLGLKLLIVLLMMEGLLWLALTLGPPRLLHYLDYKTQPWHTDDNPHWGVWHLPEVETHHVKSCVEATYTTNSHGMRDVARSEARTDGKRRVAVLGDSFAEGYLVDDADTLSQAMEREVFGGRAEVLNFGTSGYFGTTQQWLLYEHLAKRFQPDVVVVAFLNENDLFDVSWRYWQDRPPRYRPYLVPDDAANEGFSLFYPDVAPAAVSASKRIENLLMRLSAIARVANELSLRIRYAGQPPKALDVYAEPPGPLVAEAWTVVEEALRRLATATRRDGAELVVMQLVDPAQIDPARAAAVAQHAGHDIWAPQARLAAITARLGVRYLSLREAFESHRDVHALEPPYFGYSCDGHWSPLGHRVAAETLGAFLSDEGLAR